MRLILLLFIAIPFATKAQINRSATEFALEKVQEYIVQKIFKEQSYQAGAFGVLTERRVAGNRDINWSIDHWFSIGKVGGSMREYKFVFFLGKRMEVLRAEAAYTE
jgi:hypothetical protein